MIPRLLAARSPVPGDHRRYPIENTRLKDHLTLPPDYVRPKRRPPRRERPTISRLLGATALIAAAMACLPYTQIRDGWFVWWVIIIAFCLSIAMAFRGTDGAITGTLYAALYVPGILAGLVMIYVVVVLLYVWWTGVELKGLGS